MGGAYGCKVGKAGRGRFRLFHWEYSLVRVLIVVPQPAPGLSDLKTSAELVRVVSGNQATILDGNVDRAKLEMALGGQQFDVLHFAQHGDRGVLWLTDGELEMSDLISMLEPQRRVRLIILNACNSAAVASRIHNRFHIPVLYHDAPIGDEAAVRLSETFYRAFRATNGNVEESYERSVDTLARLFPKDARTPQLINGDDVTQGRLAECLGDVGKRIEAMHAEQEQVYEQFNARLDVIEGKMDALNTERGQRLMLLLLLLVGLLIVAQLLTPVLNSMLIH